MKIVAAVFADFEEDFLGGRAHLHTGIHGQTVIARLLQRLARVAGLDARCLFVRPRDEAAATDAVTGYGLQDQVDVMSLDDGRRPRRNLLRAARKWNLDGWRGSPLSSIATQRVFAPVDSPLALSISNPATVAPTSRPTPL